jgi:hypothetical protein
MKGNEADRAEWALTGPLSREHWMADSLLLGEHQIAACFLVWILIDWD